MVVETILSLDLGGNGLLEQASELLIAILDRTLKDVQSIWCVCI